MENNNTQNTDLSKLVRKACAEAQGFEDMFRRLERSMNTQRRSTSKQKNYARHLAQISLHYKCIPRVLSDDQIEDYLEGLVLKGAQCLCCKKETMVQLLNFNLRGSPAQWREIAKQQLNILKSI